MEPEKLSMIVHAVVGVVAGYASFMVNNNFGALGIMIVMMFVMRAVTNKIAKENKDMKWWLSNGGGIYFLIWFVSWIAFFNLL